MRLKIGNTISYTHCNGYIGSAVIESIELCNPNNKYGQVVNQCDTDTSNGVICLSDHHWCYFDQVKRVI